MKLEPKNLANGILQVNLIGRLDLQGTMAIDNRFSFLVSESKKDTLVDMSEVDFIASLGMRMIINNAKTLQEERKQMILINPQPLVEEALSTAGVTKFISTYKTLDEAIAALGHQA